MWLKVRARWEKRGENGREVKIKEKLRKINSG
jgi:hypothetical protein